MGGGGWGMGIGGGGGGVAGIQELGAFASVLGVVDGAITGGTGRFTSFRRGGGASRFNALVAIACCYGFATFLLKTHCLSQMPRTS